MAKHTRIHNPGPYKDYRKYKRWLRNEFSYQCIYCNINEAQHGTHRSFCVEHFKPKAIFEDLECEYSNLFYACDVCNTAKSDIWPNQLDIFFGRHFLNPCEHDLHVHIDFKNIYWSAKTTQGSFQIETLGLNFSYKTKRREQKAILSDMRDGLQIELSNWQKLFSDLNPEDVPREIGELKMKITNLSAAIDLPVLEYPADLTPP